MLMHAAAEARRRWPVLVLSLVSVSALALSAFALLASAGSQRAQNAVWSNLKLAKVDAKDAANQTLVCAPSSWADVPFMSQTVTVGGRVANPAIVTYSADLSESPINNAPTYTTFRIVVDGNQQGAGQYVLGSERFWEGMQAFTILTGALTPGSHTVEMQWQDPYGNASLCTNGPATLLIQHS